ncbi:MAG: hypothetical protein ACI96P_001685 [Candidatus Azotimanducaceae bacterium]|jgi:hypothetical protein
MDNRAEPRVTHHIRFFVHVEACDENPDLIGTSIECEAIDFSAHGMQFKTEQVLPTDTMLGITIGIGKPFSMYTLQGQIRWSRMIQEDICMGVLLVKSDDTDYAKWEATFETIFAESDSNAEN